MAQRGKALMIVFLGGNGIQSTDLSESATMEVYASRCNCSTKGNHPAKEACFTNKAACCSKQFYSI
jgi:hypothetical protein